MTRRRHVLKVVVTMLVVLGLGGAGLVWPAYEHKRDINVEIARLEALVESLAAHNAVRDDLRQKVDEAQRRLSEDVREIPRQADQAALIRNLSRPGTTQDRTFVRGNVVDAVPGAPEFGQAMPVTVEMEGRFDQVFWLIRQAENLERLVRVASVRIEADRAHDSVRPMVRATVALDAVYQSDDEVTR